MTTTEKRTIRASIDQEAISRVSSFFNAGLEDILTETLQNARRAGASTIDIKMSDGVVNISDDGRGIADPQSILAFGRSDWEFEQVQRENPAGMGFYALARLSGVTIKSKSEGEAGWEVRLTKEHFTGRAEATVEPATDLKETGVSISFQWTEASVHIAQNCARHFPLPVRLNGETLERWDFLTAAAAVHQWEGLRIAVFVGGNHEYRENINFHGVRIRDARHTPTVLTVGPPHHLWTKIDVVDCPQLELTLPARRSVVETPFLEQMAEECRRAIYQTIAESAEPIDVTYATQQEARRMGIAIPDARPMLERWLPRCEWDRGHEKEGGREPTPEGAALVTLVMETPAEHTVKRAAERNSVAERLFRPEPGLAGYRWYDALDRIREVRFTARDGDGEEDVTLAISRQQERMCDGLSVTLEVERQNGKMEPLELPTDVVLNQTDEEQMWNAAPLVALNSGLAVDDLAELLMQAHFQPNYDSDCDTYETQEYQANEEARDIAIRMLRSDEEALRDAALEALRHAGITGRMRPGSTICVHLDDQKRASVRMTTPADED